MQGRAGQLGSQQARKQQAKRAAAGPAAPEFAKPASAAFTVMTLQGKADEMTSWDLVRMRRARGRRRPGRLPGPCIGGSFAGACTGQSLCSSASGNSP